MGRYGDRRGRGGRGRRRLVCIMNKLNNITITYNILIMIHMYKIIITPHIILVILINCSGSKLNETTIIILFSSP
jgi:hypothetical protein